MRSSHPILVLLLLEVVRRGSRRSLEVRWGRCCLAAVVDELCRRGCSRLLRACQRRSRRDTKFGSIAVASHDRVDHVKGRLPGLGKPVSPLFVVVVVVGHSFVFVCDCCVELVKGVAQVVDWNVGQ